SAVLIGVHSRSFAVRLNRYGLDATQRRETARVERRALPSGSHEDLGVEDFREPTHACPSQEGTWRRALAIMFPSWEGCKGDEDRYFAGAVHSKTSSDTA